MRSPDVPPAAGLLIDTEKQGNATDPLLNGTKPTLTLYDVLFGKATSLRPPVTARENLRIVRRTPASTKPRTTSPSR